MRQMRNPGIRKHEELIDVTITRKDEIKWCQRPFTAIIDTSFEMLPVEVTYPLNLYEYFKQNVPGEIFDRQH